MSQESKAYIAIDLKSFYASVECMERGLDPLTTNLVVADPSRTQKTICLAVSPSLKRHGISGRARLFEVVQRVSEVNKERLAKGNLQEFSGSSWNANEIDLHPDVEIDYIVAPPQMAHYMEISASIYDVYLKYIAPEDIHVYSIDEVFIDVTSYLHIYNKTPHEIAMMLIHDVLDTTGITATAGVGTNMYLAKIAMDIVAKHMPADEDGVRIAELDERSYREKLWAHQPLTDFWRVGKGYQKRLEKVGLYTMGDIARCSIGGPNDYYNEDLLYKIFGINAELLIDHAWGYEPCEIKDIKAYRPENNSLGTGMVLQESYTFEQTRLVTKEIADMLVLDMVSKHVVTDQLVLTIGYDRENLDDPERRRIYKGPVTVDRYGRMVPKSAHGTKNLKKYTSSTMLIVEALMELFDEMVDPFLLVRRINLTANHVIWEKDAEEKQQFEQLSLFDMMEETKKEDEVKKKDLEKEKQLQKAMLDIKNRYGKNAILKGMNLEEGAMAKQRNSQIGGHKA